MDAFGHLDEIVLTRFLACLLQREALALAGLAADWPELVAAHLRRLVVGPSVPIHAVVFAAKSFRRLRDVSLDGRGLSGGAGEFGFITSVTGSQHHGHAVMSFASPCFPCTLFGCGQ